MRDRWDDAQALTAHEGHQVPVDLPSVGLRSRSSCTPPGQRPREEETYRTRAASSGSSTKSLPAASSAATSTSWLATWGFGCASSTLRFSIELLDSMAGGAEGRRSLTVKASAAGGRTGGGERTGGGTGGGVVAGGRDLEGQMDEGLYRK